MSSVECASDPEGERMKFNRPSSLSVGSEGEEDDMVFGGLGMSCLPEGIRASIAGAGVLEDADGASTGVKYHCVRGESTDLSQSPQGRTGRGAGRGIPVSSKCDWG
jgi:hypothetical protein